MSIGYFYWSAQQLAMQAKTEGVERVEGTIPQPLLLNQGCWLSLRDGMAR